MRGSRRTTGDRRRRQATVASNAHVVRRRLTSSVVVLAVAAVVSPAVTTASAQVDTQTDRPWYVSVSKWGKWGALLSAAGFTTMAVVRNSDANDVFAFLNSLCRTSNDACRLQANGRYVAQDAEVLYRETLRLDRQARAWMIVGQVSLVAAGGMFLIDLVAGGDGPQDIPFSPLEVMTEPDRVGLRIRF